MIAGTIAVVALFLIVIAGRYSWFRRPVTRCVHAPMTGGVLVLRRPTRSGIMLGLGALAPAVVLGVVAARVWVAEGTGTAGRIAVALATLLALAVSAHQFIAAFRCRVIVRASGIERIGVATRRHVRWEDVASVAYNSIHHWFFLTNADGSHLWLSEELHGIGDFAALALQRLPPAALHGDPIVREELEDLAASARVAVASG